MPIGQKEFKNNLRLNDSSTKTNTFFTCLNEEEKKSFFMSVEITFLVRA